MIGFIEVLSFICAKRLLAGHAQQISKQVMLIQPVQHAPTLRPCPPESLWNAYRRILTQPGDFNQPVIMNTATLAQRISSAINVNLAAKIRDLEISQNIRNRPGPSVNITVQRTVQRQRMLLAEIHCQLHTAPVGIGVDQISKVQISRAHLNLPATDIWQKFLLPLWTIGEVVLNLPERFACPFEAMLNRIMCGFLAQIQHQIVMLKIHVGYLFLRVRIANVGVRRLNDVNSERLCCHACLRGLSCWARQTACLPLSYFFGTTSPKRLPVVNFDPL